MDGGGIGGQGESMESVWGCDDAPECWIPCPCRLTSQYALDKPWPKLIPRAGATAEHCPNTYRPPRSQILPDIQLQQGNNSDSGVKNVAGREKGDWEQASISRYPTICSQTRSFSSQTLSAKGQARVMVQSDSLI